MAISGALIPVNLAQVQSLIGKTVIIGSQAQETDSPLTEDSIRRLEAILSTVKTQEEQFYRMLNISGDVDAGLRKFQAILDDKLNKSGVIKLLNVPESELNIVVENIGERTIIQSLEQGFSMEIKKSGFRKVFADVFKDEIVTITAEEFIRKTQTFSKGKKDVHTFYNITGKNDSGAKGLQRYIGEITWDPTKKKSERIQVKFIDDIPKKYADILERDYGVKFPDLMTDQGNIIENTKNYVNRVIKDAEIKTYILNDLNAVADKYSVNKSANSIKGFLGELAMNAVLYSLTKIYPQATGAITKICKEGKGQEIPIDIILKNFGFQVKNYSEIDSTVSFGHKSINDSMGLGNFIVGRVHPREDIGQVLLELYGSYAYNQVADNPLAEQRFGSTRERLESIANDSEPMKKLFDQHIDNILKISDTFAANSKFFAKERIYYNTFFIINRRFVPSSRILQTLINKLRKTQNSEAISSSYTFSLSLAEKGYAYPYQKQSNLSALDYANKSKINYSIKLNLDEVLQEALNSV